VNGSKGWEIGVLLGRFLGLWCSRGGGIVFGAEAFRESTSAWAGDCSVGSVGVVWRLADDCRWNVCGMCVVWVAV
jgi:hypothetical protein